MKLIIPMAGLGTRFRAVADQHPEYRKPKPFIDVRGLPMIRWATGSLPFVEHPDQTPSTQPKITSKDLIFLILEEHDRVHGIAEQLRQIYGAEARVISLPHVTRGAAETACLARALVDPKEEIIISDSDHYFPGAALWEAIQKKDSDTMGIIPTFTPVNDGIPRWSYSLVQPGTTVIHHVGEKDADLMRQGARANIGAYYFTSAEIFFNEIEKTIREKRLSGEKGKEEFYVAPTYQHLIEQGAKIQAAHTKEVWGLGTPSDLERFLLECPHAHP